MQNCNSMILAKAKHKSHPFLFWKLHCWNFPFPIFFVYAYTPPKVWISLHNSSNLNLSSFSSSIHSHFHLFQALTSLISTKYHHQGLPKSLWCQRNHNIRHSKCTFQTLHAKEWVNMIISYGFDTPKHAWTSNAFGQQTKLNLNASLILFQLNFCRRQNNVNKSNCGKWKREHVNNKISAYQKLLRQTVSQLDTVQTQFQNSSPCWVTCPPVIKNSQPHLSCLMITCTETEESGHVPFWIICLSVLFWLPPGLVWSCV